MRPRHRLLAAFLPLLLLLAVACDSTRPSPDSTPTVPSAAPPPAASPTAPSGLTVEPDGSRAMAHVLHLADAIGPRPAGSVQDRQAAEYIAEQLRSYGYEVTIQEFPAASEASRESRLNIVSPSPRIIPTLPLSRSAAGSVRAAVVSAGIGRPSDFPLDARGKIALIERGELTFQDKVANAQQAGARGVVIYNNEPGSFLGSLATESTVPAVSISREDGQALLAQLRGGTVEVELSVAPLATTTSFNVIARPPGRQCETVSGGHYDSVPLAPGASDNASGTAAVLEIALVIAKNGRMANHCFVLFGAEELGLIGSRAFVERLTTEEKTRIRAMFNYDMVGVGEAWLLIGHPDLQAKASELARDLGIAATRGQLQNNLSSDHASFSAAGIPAFMLHRITDTLLHTPQDVSSRVRPELLEEAARLGVALLESMAGG